MKTTILKQVMMTAIAAVVTMTFAACGGKDDAAETYTPPVQAPNDNGTTKDDDKSGGDNGSTGGNTGQETAEFKYIVPFVDWDATKDEVVAEMAKNGLSLDDPESYNNSMLNFYGEDLSYFTSYAFLRNKLVAVQYLYNVWYSEEKLMTVVTETEKLYNIKMQLERDDEDMKSYFAEAVIDGHNTRVTAFGTKAYYITLMFEVDD